jgi:hypothetical protein
MKVTNCIMKKWELTEYTAKQYANTKLGNIMKMATTLGGRQAVKINREKKRK